jgi:hypothetical protein
MRPRDGAARVRCWELRQERSNRAAASGFVGPRRPPPRPGKDFLGAAVTLAIIGVIVLQATDRLASRCGAAGSPHPAAGACSGISALAHRADGIVTVCVLAFTVLAALAFVWYMLWGYKANQQTGEDGDTSFPRG